MTGPLRPRGFAGCRPALLVATLVAIAGMTTSAKAQVPPEFQGRWSLETGRCEPDDKEASILTIGRSVSDELEIGCQLTSPQRLPHGVKFAARCQAHGFPPSPAVVLMEHPSPDTLSIAYLSLKAVGEMPTTYHRCSR